MKGVVECPVPISKAIRYRSIKSISSVAKSNTVFFKTGEYIISIYQGKKCNAPLSTSLTYFYKRQKILPLYSIATEIRSLRHK